MLSTSGLVSGYGRQTTLHGVDMAAPRGEITAIIGPNGSGKSTLLKTVAGLIKPREGSVRFDGEEIAGRRAHALVSDGLCMVPQGRVVFPLLTVEENLRMSGFTLRQDPLLRKRVDEAYEAWPVLAARRRQPAGTLSGGEQMMLSLAKVTLLRPRLLLLDEPSLGLAPKMIDEVYGRLVALAGDGLTTVVVEQNVRQALKVAAHAVVLVLGEVRYQGGVARLESEVDLGRLFMEGR